MGYTTEFSGEFTISPPLSSDQVKYINRFSSTRRMQRDSKIASTFADPLRLAVKLPIGKEGEFYVGDGSNYGQEKDHSVIDYNRPPATQPGLWCQWIVSEDGKGLHWDGGEKFYDYVEWLEYMIKHFFTPWKRKINGRVRFRGEEFDDVGSIVCKNNKVCLDVFEE